MWNPATGELALPPLTGHGSSVTSVAFRPDGNLLASADRDGTVRLWDPSNGMPIGGPLAGNELGIASLAFSPDGDMLATGGDDGFVRLWNWDLDEACALAVQYVTRSQIEPYLPSGWNVRCPYRD